MYLFESTPEAKFRRRVQSFAKEHVAPVAEKVEEGWFPREVLRKLGEQQLLGVAFSKSDGGLGLGWSFEVIVAEEISAVSGLQKWPGWLQGHCTLRHSLTLQVVRRNGGFSDLCSRGRRLGRLR